MSVFRVTFTGQWYAAVYCQNVVCFHNPDGYYTPATGAAELRDNWCTLLAAGQTTQFGWRNISIDQVGSSAAPYNLPIVVNGLDGADASAALPPICQKFRIHTAVAGRSGRGRIYLPGYRASLWTAGVLNATGITNMTARLNAITARYVGGSRTSQFSLGILKRSGSDADFIHCDFLNLSLTPGIQRRRNVGIGI